MNYILFTILDRLPLLPDQGDESHWYDYFVDLWTNIKEGYYGLVNEFRYITTFFDDLYEAINNFAEKMRNLSLYGSIDKFEDTGFVFDEVLAGIRWCVGDLLYTEMYLLLIVGIIFTFMKVFMKVFDVLKYIFASFGGIPGIKSLTGGFIDAIKGWF